MSRLSIKDEARQQKIINFNFKKMITSTEFKSFIDLASSSYDTKIALIVAGVNKFIQNYCCNQLVSGEVTEYFDGDEVVDYELFLENRINLSSVVVSYNTGTESVPVWVVEDRADYIERLDEGIIKLDSVRAGEKNYKVVYTAGFTLTGESANVPDDLKLGCLKLASAFFNKSKSEGQGSEGLDGASISFTKSITPEIKELIGNYCSKNI